MKTITTKLDSKLRIPMVPNFIGDERGRARPVGDLPDDVLREIGEEWTEELLERAKQQRESGAAKCPPK